MLHRSIFCAAWDNFAIWLSTKNGNTHEYRCVGVLCYTAACPSGAATTRFKTRLYVTKSLLPPLPRTSGWPCVWQADQAANTYALHYCPSTHISSNPADTRYVVIVSECKCANYRDVVEIEFVRAMPAGARRSVLAVCSLVPGPLKP